MLGLRGCLQGLARRSLAPVQRRASACLERFLIRFHLNHVPFMPFPDQDFKNTVKARVLLAERRR